MTPEFLTLADTATALKIEPHHVKDLVATGKIRCGLFVPRWKGQASIVHRRSGKGLHWEGEAVDFNPRDPRLKSWHYRCVETSEEYTVADTWIAQFWYLHHSTAYPLALAGADGVDCEWLAPLDPASLHLHSPDCFPWPNDFIFDVAKEQEQSRRITWENIRFRQPDVEALTREQKSPAVQAGSAQIPWQEVARTIADELWAGDHAQGFERTLKQYADLVEVEMQKRRIQGARGILDAKNIQREALGGHLWWANRKK
ncbi:hypothetical protein [Immundisolibacter cernigliae]|uniref:Uncharacterized protein n=1 Tax=Immundisolibacter cernigliae TaxID=1810504 RepID=A0A1B1YVI0_9GAMM|nr:hypothetical protein [Immundisolibacter cernigliae]ANX04727.1 hypothetical protein PG2T_11490 [Immundisolibacter cernigliae]